MRPGRNCSCMVQTRRLTSSFIHPPLGNSMMKRWKGQSSVHSFIPSFIAWPSAWLVGWCTDFGDFGSRLSESVHTIRQNYVCQLRPANAASIVATFFKFHSRSRSPRGERQRNLQGREERKRPLISSSVSFALQLQRGVRLRESLSQDPIEFRQEIRLINLNSCPRIRLERTLRPDRWGVLASWVSSVLWTLGQTRGER